MRSGADSVGGTGRTRPGRQVVELEPRRALVGGIVGAAAVAAVAVLVRRLAGISVDPRALTLVGASMATALMYALAVVGFLWWRVAGDRRSLYISAACLCYATFPLMLGVVAPSVSSSDLGGISTAFQLAGGPAIVVFGLAARRSGPKAARGPDALLAGLVLGTVSTAALLLAVPLVGALQLDPVLTRPFSARVAAGAIALVWVAVTVAHARSARRRRGRGPWTWTVAAAGMALAYGIETLPGRWAPAAAWLAMAAALVAGLCGVAVELRRHYAAERRDLRDALVQIAVARAHAQAVDQSRAELRHDARAALLGIEAAARGLSRHRDQLTPEQWDELSDGLVAEVHRLGGLLDGRTESTSSFDLRSVVMPVLACARAEGLVITAAVPEGVDVGGSRDGTAHALVSLLANARTHASGAPIDVRVVVGEGDATVYVHDRGPGVPRGLRESLFERGIRGATSAGSGIGLYVARRLVSEAGGALWFEPGVDGGSTFAIRLPRTGYRAGPAPTPTVVPDRMVLDLTGVS
jgi:signal transduction histidine kinase